MYNKTNPSYITFHSSHDKKGVSLDQMPYTRKLFKYGNKISSDKTHQIVGSEWTNVLKFCVMIMCWTGRWQIALALSKDSQKWIAIVNQDVTGIIEDFLTVWNQLINWGYKQN